MDRARVVVFAERPTRASRSTDRSLEARGAILNGNVLNCHEHGSKPAHEGIGAGEEFAERCGLSQSFVADIERGKKFPSPASIEKICAALEIRPFELFLGPEDFSGVPGSEILTEDLLRLKDSITDAIGATLDRLVPR